MTEGSPSAHLLAKLRPVRVLRSALLLATFLVPPAVQASAQVPASADTVRSRALVSRRELLVLGTVAALAGAAYAADPDVRSWSQREAVQANALGEAASAIGYPYGGFVAFAGSAALWGTGLLTRREGVATTGLRAVEAIAVGGTLTSLLKNVFGRARPRVAPHERDAFDLGRGFNGGHGGDFRALPSGHATAAFAFAAAVTSEVAARAPRHARLVAALSYGLGVITVYDRLHQDAHWLSDVTLGAGIGVVSGLAVTRWHRANPGSCLDRILLRPFVGAGADGSTRVGMALCRR